MTGKNATWPGSGCSTEMPSKRYSFVRGRPPLMRGSCEFGGSATPGASDASVMNVAAVQRQLHDLLVLDDVAEAGGFGAQHRGIGGDGHLLADVADGEIEIDPRFFSRRQVNTRRAAPA